MFAEVFLGSLLGSLAYQAIGAGVLLPFELLFPRSRISFSAWSRGMLFLIASTPIVALVAAISASIKAPTLIAFHGGFWSPVVASIVLGLWVDFQFYVKHRVEHSRLIWPFHQVHHSIRDLSGAGSYHHWTEPVWGLTVAIPLMFTDIQIVPTLALMNVLFHFQQFYIHSSTRVHLGPLRFLLVDNRYHRIHHSTDPAHHGKNFGAMTPLWDWLFGTLHMPAKDEWPAVGLKEVDEPQNLREWAFPWRSRNRVNLPGSRPSRNPGYGANSRPA